MAQYLYKDAGLTVAENERFNGFEIQYIRKMTDDEIEMIKDAGFRWSRYRQFWYAHRNPQTKEFVDGLIRRASVAYEQSAGDNGIAVQSGGSDTEEKAVDGFEGKKNPGQLLSAGAGILTERVTERPVTVSPTRTGGAAGSVIPEGGEERNPAGIDTPAGAGSPSDRTAGKPAADSLTGTGDVPSSAVTIPQAGKLSSGEADITEIRASLKAALEELAVPVPEIAFTRENYNALFPTSTVDTPVEQVKLGAHQFEKLEAKDRQYLLKAVHDTLAEPGIVVTEKRTDVFGDETEARLYVKSYLFGEIANGKVQGVLSVVVDIGDESVSISTHRRDLSNILNKIQNPGQILYISGEVAGAARRFTESRNETGKTQAARTEDGSLPPEIPHGDAADRRLDEILDNLETHFSKIRGVRPGSDRALEYLERFKGYYEDDVRRFAEAGNTALEHISRCAAGMYEDAIAGFKDGKEYLDRESLRRKWAPEFRIEKQGQAEEKENGKERMERSAAAGAAPSGEIADKVGNETGAAQEDPEDYRQESVKESSLTGLQKKAVETGEEAVPQPEPETEFSCEEFEKHIPNRMRFKEVHPVGEDAVHWITQEIFTVKDLRDFQQAVKDYGGGVKKFFVIPRDLSSYDFAEDMAQNVLAEVTADSILKDSYVNAVRRAGLEEYLVPEERDGFQKTVENLLLETAVPLVEIPLTEDNYKTLFPQGIVETPVETVKLGANQFEKLNRPDRNNLLGAMYETLVSPVVVFEKETFDGKTGDFRPIHIYGKSFYRENPDKTRMVETVVISREGMNISISVHNKDTARFVKQIKTPGQLLYAAAETGRVIPFGSFSGRDHVRTLGASAPFINPKYNPDSVLSITELIRDPQPVPGQKMPGIGQEGAGTDMPGENPYEKLRESLQRQDQYDSGGFNFFIRYMPETKKYFGQIFRDDGSSFINRSVRNARNHRYTSKEFDGRTEVISDLVEVAASNRFLESPEEYKKRQERNVAPENGLQEDSRESARNYVLEKLRAAGIEVVTDKDAFEAALKKAKETGSPVQKMAQGVLPEELFATQTAGGLEEAVRSLSKGDVNLQDEYIDIAERTPAIFQRLGLADFPVRMYRQKLARALFLEKYKDNERFTHGHKDEYTEKEVMEVFGALADPRYVFRSKHSLPGGVPDLVAVYDVFDRDGNPMMISLRYNKNRKEVEANWVTSIYGKRKDVLVEDWAGNGYLIYMNDMGMEKASAEVVTLHMRVSKSAEAFKSSGEVVTLKLRVSKSPEPGNSILLKSRLVNGHDVSCMKKDGEIYGFADISQPGGKIYLNPDIFTAETAAHEYTHIWDHYIRMTDRELWEKGKEVFSRTGLWQEVLEDPEYRDIAPYDDLVMSECHARIVGKAAEKILASIAEKDGQTALDAVIDWEAEAEAYIAAEFFNLDRAERGTAAALLAMPLRDLAEGKALEWEKSVKPDFKPSDGNSFSAGQMRKIRAEAKRILEEKGVGEMTAEDKRILALYEGGGGLAEKGRTAAEILNAFYTPRLLVEKVWKLADAYAPDAVTVLEPSAGTGRFAENRPRNRFTLHELDETSARIAEILHPDAEVIQGAFQKQFFDETERFLRTGYEAPKYDLVIGNPPYGEYTGKYKGLGEGKEFSRNEEYFTARGLDSLKDEKSVLAFVVPDSFLDSVEDKAKRMISGKGKIIDAYRLPSGVFPTTDVCTDIIVMKKWNGETEAEKQENLSLLSSGEYFRQHPEKILGQTRTRKNRFGQAETYTSIPDGITVQEELDRIDAFAETIRAQIRLRRDADVQIEERTAGGESLPQEEKAMHTIRSVQKTKAKEAPPEKRKEKLLSAEEFAGKYGKKFSREEMEIWRATDWRGYVDLSRLSPEGMAALQDSGDYIEEEPGKWTHKVLFTSGNIREKTGAYRKRLEGEKNESLRNLYERNIRALENASPQTIPFDRIHFGVNTTLAEEFKTGRKVECTVGTYGETAEMSVSCEADLRELFILWARGETIETELNRTTYRKAEDLLTAVENHAWAYDRTLNYNTANISKEDFPDNVTWDDVIEYMSGKPVRAQVVSSYQRRHMSDEEYRELQSQMKREADEKRILRAETADRLFDRFLHEGTDGEMQKRIETEYNRRFNNFSHPAYEKLPLYIDGMNAYKNGEGFKLYDQQIKGISFLCNKGNGILAYDVGVGKTAAGIVATVNQIQSGRSKRPLIIVPNSVYSKWLNDIRELFPAVKVNDLYNLNASSTAPFRNAGDSHKLDIPENSVSLATYEALSNISFTDESCENGLFEDFSKLLSDMQEAYSDVVYAEKIKRAIGSAAQVKNDNFVFFERCGFDNLTVDEAHNFKNLWTVPRPKHKGMSNDFSGIPSGKPSARALTMYAMTQIVQQKNENRNVFMLTATPFTNSPLEVYSMLSYVGRQRLIEAGIYSLRDFLYQFAQTKQELAVNPKGEVSLKQVMKNWKELPALQNMITEYIDKVDGEEAGIIRPHKITHVAEIEQSVLQQEMLMMDTLRMTTDKSSPAATITAMNAMRLALVAPALADKDRYPGIEIPSKDQLVETSPKLSFVCGMVLNMYKDNPEKGQFLYIPLGQEAHVYVKDYLTRNGIPEEAVEIINGTVNSTSEKKNRVTEKFNDPENKCKIVIGGKNTCEGIDLNGNSFVMYNCSLGWNPSETVQAEGRIWRQGNRQGHVHCVYPVMNDSIDSVLYQKHDEKKSRIDDLWKYKGESLNIEDINPEELKFDLIKDPDKKAALILSESTKELKSELNKVQSRINSCDLLIETFVRYKGYLQEADREYQSLLYKKQIAEKTGERLSLSETDRLQREKKNRQRYENTVKVMTKKLECLGAADEDGQHAYMQELILKKQEIQKKIEEKTNELPALIEELKKKREAEKNGNPSSVGKLIEDYTRKVTENLRPMSEIIEEGKRKKGVQENKTSREFDEKENRSESVQNSAEGMEMETDSSGQLSLFGISEMNPPDPSKENAVQEKQKPSAGENTPENGRSSRQKDAGMKSGRQQLAFPSVKNQREKVCVERW